jgi:hypothetical protein
MILVTTRFCGPTNCRPARVSVTGPNGRRKFVPWEYSHDPSANHDAAAFASVSEWFGDASLSVVGACESHDGRGNVYMFGRVSE